MLSELINSKHIVGLKQTLRAVKENAVKVVYIASDADSGVVAPLLDICNKNDIPVVKTGSMKELGEILNIEVETAVAAILL